MKWNEALNYAATKSSRTFGTDFLVYPMKSSTFRGLLSEAKSGTAAGLVIQIDLGMLQSLYKVGSHDECSASSWALRQRIILGMRPATARDRFQWGTLLVPFPPG